MTPLYITREGVMCTVASLLGVAFGFFLGSYIMIHLMVPHETMWEVFKEILS